MPLAKKCLNFVNLDTPQGRFYWSPNNPDIYYPSVTTIIGWKPDNKKKGGYTGPAAAIGSLTHYKCLKKFSDHPLEFPSDPIWGVSNEEATRRLTECCRMWDELLTTFYKINHLKVESVIYSANPRYAGRIDDLVKFKQTKDSPWELSLWDIKTGASYEPKHSMQAAAYWHALKRKPKTVKFFYLDAIVGRNPDQCGTIHTYDTYALEAAFEEFQDKYLDYGGPLGPDPVKFV